MRSCRRQEDIGLRPLYTARAMQTNELLGMMDDPVVRAFQVSCLRPCFVSDCRQARSDEHALIKANLRNVGLSHVYAGSHQVSATAAEDKQNFMAMRDCRSLRCVLSSATPRSANSQRAHRMKCGMTSRRLSHQNECYRTIDCPGCLP